MDKNKPDRNKSYDSSCTSTSAVPSIKPLPKARKPMRGNTDKRDGSNDQFPSAL